MLINLSKTDLEILTNYLGSDLEEDNEPWSSFKKTAGKADEVGVIIKRYFDLPVDKADTFIELFTDLKRRIRLAYEKEVGE